MNTGNESRILAGEGRPCVSITVDTRKDPALRASGSRIPVASLTSIAVVLVLAAVSLLLFGLVALPPGLAASEPIPVHSLVPSSSLPFATTVTTTVFLPLVYRAEIALDNLWLAEYYDNANLSGDPVYTAEEKRVDYNWGNNSPTGLPRNYFSIRWTGDWDFEYGEYTFLAYADDGMRLWLDDELLIDYWLPGQGPHEAKLIIQVAGRHRLKLEYFEQTGAASIHLRWRRTDLYPQWQGTYYNQPWVEAGSKVYDQTDSTIEFDWGNGCPVGLPCDSFSIRWRANPVFEAGTYRFFIYADEGYQLFVDGTNVKEGGWYDGEGGGSVDTYYDLPVSSTQYRNIRFNFHDRGGLAEARLLIQKRGQPDWTAQYYGNKNLSGTPVTTKQEEVVFRDWGSGKPYPAVPADGFSARWTGQRYFHAGCYRFGLFADDGVRLWVDGELLVNEWHDGRSEYHGPYTYLTTGYHDVVIEYYENTGDAEIRFWWE